MTFLPPVVHQFVEELAELGWVSDLLIGGSLATGDYTPRVSDLDLVAIVDAVVDPARRDRLTALHRHLDAGAGADFQLGCVYVDRAQLGDLSAVHPTWTHGQLVQRILSGSRGPNSCATAGRFSVAHRSTCLRR